MHIVLVYTHLEFTVNQAVCLYHNKVPKIQHIGIKDHNAYNTYMYAIVTISGVHIGAHRGVLGDAYKHPLAPN